MTLKTIVILAFQVSLWLTVFGFGLQATREDVLYLVRRPGLLGRSVLAMFVVVPIAIVTLVRAFNFPLPLEVVLVALAISPVPPLLPRKTQSVGAHSAFPLALVTTMALLSIVIVPIAALILGQLFGRTIAPPLGTLGAIVLKAVLAPLVAGMMIHKLMPRAAARVQKPLAIGAGALLAAAVVVLVGANLSTLWSLAQADTVAGIIVFVLIGLAAGHWLGGPDPEQEGVLALASASRHPGIALALASANYPLEHFGGTILLYLLVNAIVGVPYAKWQSSRTTATPA